MKFETILVQARFFIIIKELEFKCAWLYILKRSVQFMEVATIMVHTEVPSF